MNTVKDRLIEFYESLGLKKSEFEKMCNLSNGYMEKLRNCPKPEKLEIIYLTFPQLNSTWLLTGEGEMLKEPVGDAPESAPTLGDLARMIADHDRRFHDQMERIMDAMGIEKTVKKERTA